MEGHFYFILAEHTALPLFSFSFYSLTISLCTFPRGGEVVDIINLDEDISFFAAFSRQVCGYYSNLYNFPSRICRFTDLQPLEACTQMKKNDMLGFTWEGGNTIKTVY